MNPCYADIEASLVSPDAFLARSDEPQVFGARKQAAAAHETWSTATERWVGAYQGLRVPGGTGTGLVLRLFWNPVAVDPDPEAIRSAVLTDLPTKLLRDDEKATWKARNKRQGTFFVWRGPADRPLARWCRENFGVSAFVSQLFAPSDLSQNVAVVASSGGVENLWTLTAPE
jgi:hypothetical protein